MMLLEPRRTEANVQSSPATRDRPVLSPLCVTSLALAVLLRRNLAQLPQFLANDGELLLVREHTDHHTGSILAGAIDQLGQFAFFGGIGRDRGDDLRAAVVLVFAGSDVNLAHQFAIGGAGAHRSGKQERADRPQMHGARFILDVRHHIRRSASGKTQWRTARSDIGRPPGARSLGGVGDWLRDAATQTFANQGRSNDARSQIG